MALRIVEEAGLTDVGRQRQRERGPLVRRRRSSPSPTAWAARGQARWRRRSRWTSSPRRSRRATAARRSGWRAIVRAANRKIYDLARSGRVARRHGHDASPRRWWPRQEVSLGHVGDSRAYRFRDDELERLTQDHSLVEELMRMGKLIAGGRRVRSAPLDHHARAGPGAGRGGRDLHLSGRGRGRLPDLLGRPHGHGARGAGGGDPALALVARAGGAGARATTRTRAAARTTSRWCCSSSATRRRRRGARVRHAEGAEPPAAADRGA